MTRHVMFLLVLTSACAGSTAPTAEEQARALALTWDGSLQMSDYPRPELQWFVGGDCQHVREGTPLLDGKCYGATAGLNGDHRTSDLTLPWPGAIAPSPLCWGLITLRGGIRTGVVPFIANDDPDVAACQQLLAGAGL